MADTKSARILIGGITGGIGQALAQQLLEQGHSVSGFARDASKLQAFATDFPKAQVYEVDAHDAAAVQGVVDAVTEDGPLDGYAHAIGSILIKPLAALKPEEFEDTLSLNLGTAFKALKAVVPALQKSKGSAVFFSTVAARTGLANHEAIAAAKAGVEGMVRSAAASLALRGVRINAVAPGMTDTPLAAPLLQSDSTRKASEAMHPLGRIGRPEEIASLAAWLLSAHAGWVTGQIMSVDGGLSTVTPRPRT
ncbi:MAG: SDR family NAD(P)-dependent oxidoreductase [Opitutales bacterium]